MSTSTYNGWTITKTDTGGRRLGREVQYNAFKNGKGLAHAQLNGLKTLIDIFDLDFDQTGRYMEAISCGACHEDAMDAAYSK